jgi:hypothetical protein
MLDDALVSGLGRAIESGSGDFRRHDAILKSRIGETAGGMPASNGISILLIDWRLKASLGNLHLLQVALFDMRALRICRAG